MSIFKGIFSPTYGYLRTISCLAVGIVLILWPDVAAKTLIMAVGALLFIVGCVSLVLSVRKSIAFGNMMSINGLFNILFGLVLMLCTDFFISFIMYVFGFFFIVFGVSQISSLGAASQYSKISIGYYITPILFALCGFVLFFKPFEAQETIFIFIGACLVLYALSELFATLKVNRVIKSHTQEESQQTIDTPYEEVSSETLKESN